MPFFTGSKHHVGRARSRAFVSHYVMGAAQKVKFSVKPHKSIVKLGNGLQSALWKELHLDAWCVVSTQQFCGKHGVPTRYLSLRISRQKACCNHSKSHRCQTLLRQLPTAGPSQKQLPSSAFSRQSLTRLCKPEP